MAETVELAGSVEATEATEVTERSRRGERPRSGGRRWRCALVGVVAAVLVVPALVAAPVTAEPGGTSDVVPAGGADLTGDHQRVFWTPDGPVDEPSSLGPAALERDPAAAANGYILQGSESRAGGDAVGAASRYSVRLVGDHAQWAKLTAPVTQSAIQLSAATGGDYAMGSRLSDPDLLLYTITVSLNSGNACGDGAIGCAVTYYWPDPTGTYWEISAATVWISPSLLNEPPALLKETILHELGHAAGLDHFDGNYQGKHQVMRSYLDYDAIGSYQMGDQNGLAKSAALGFANGTIIPKACLITIKDVRVNSPFCGDIKWMINSGTGTGYADGSFRPTATLTRQAAASFLHKMQGSPGVPAGAPNFSDVPVGHTFRTAIRWMAGKGITSGYAGGTFRPTATLTRQAIASFLYQLAGRPSVPANAPRFSDVPTNHPFHDAIRWLASERISTGYADGTFRPSAPVSRQAMAAFLHKYAT